MPSSRLARHPDVMIADPEAHRGRWRELFAQDAPIRLEIGIGKGRFLFETAKMNPHVNFIGIEKYDSVIVRALDELLAELLRNRPARPYGRRRPAQRVRLPANSILSISTSPTRGRRRTMPSAASQARCFSPATRRF
ncbi:MAG: hypothetical protein MZW92_59505 [Comamonadaceae bacterium]|nr:hypothetical protein [Comamonadaceae bacterium]